MLNIHDIQRNPYKRVLIHVHCNPVVRELIAMTVAVQQAARQASRILKSGLSDPIILAIAVL